MRKSGVVENYVSVVQDTHESCKTGVGYAVRVFKVHLGVALRPC